METRDVYIIYTSIKSFASVETKSGLIPDESVEHLKYE